MKIRLFLLLIAPALLCFGAPRTWISASGDDAAACTRTAPCKTFAGALANTSSGGEIDVLDSGDFGTVTILQNLTIDGGGNIASGAAITLAAGHVVIRNLTLAATGVGISMASGATGRIERVLIRPDTVAGIMNYGVVALGPAGVLSLEDVRIQDALTSGISVLGGKVSLTRCSLIHNAVGLAVLNNATVQVDHSFVQFNSIAGVSTDENSTASAGGNMRLSDTTITDNAIGLQLGGTGTPSIVTFGNNRIFGNTVNGNP
ncbi:MAG TPA: right-handed parallel beta-helix repeat-containing protein, partial [Candidatus Sulfopaludibacter sp.]|nr:right-handed parallel beta-helix repeat-containing protein [Candidatus Sulfopaludibacter sp.]